MRPFLFLPPQQRPAMSITLSSASLPIFRTGLANLMTGVLFLAAMFLTPLYSVVPIEAAAPALVVVGALTKTYQAVQFVR